LALYNYIGASEADALIGATKGTDAFPSHRRLVESSGHALPLIFSDCPEEDVEPEIDQSVFEEASELLDFTWKYETINYSFELADRGQFEIHVAGKDPRITFAYAEQYAGLADTEIRALELKDIETNFEGTDPAQVAEEIAQELRVALKSGSGEKCDYEFTSQLASLAQQYGDAVLLKSNLAEIPASERFGSLELGNLQTFWATLIGITHVHVASHAIAYGGQLCDEWAETFVHCRTEAEFKELVSCCSNLDSELVDLLIRWHTYDPAIGAAMPILQPFLPLNCSQLCLPSLFIIGNSFERNFRKLANRHPEMRQAAGELEARLESIALEDISALFPKPQFRVRKQVDIPSVTDADIVVFDFDSHSTLIIQHKWLIAPDTLLESSSNDEKLLSGVKQAVLARECFREDLSRFKSAMELETDQQIGDIEAVTVCRGLGHTGFLPDPAVPVLAEMDFRNLVAQSSDLAHLWGLLSTRPDRSKAADKSEDMKTSLTLCGYEFVIPGLATFA